MIAVTVAAAPDCVIVDTSWKLTAASITALAAATWEGQPIKGIVRYVSIHDESKQDIDAEELATIIGAGLGCMLVQHVRYPGWQATASQGQADGLAAGANAKGAGYPMGANLWLDLEGVANVGAEVIDYVNAWATAVAAQGFIPSLYVGYSCGLTPQQLYESLPDIHAYWSDAGPRDVERRGFCMKQHTQTALGGVQVDPDTVTADKLGGRPMWAIAADDAAQAAA